MEFKVGDKVRILDANKIINNRFKLTKGKEYEVLSFHEKSDTDVEHIKVADNFSKPFMICDWEYKYIEKVDKPTKKQRIEALEKEVAELKERVEALEQAEKQRYVMGVDVAKEVHKTPNLDIDLSDLPKGTYIRHEDKLYKKVDRRAKAGDVVVFVEHLAPWTKDTILNKPYLVDEKRKYTDDVGDKLFPIDCDVYEPLEQPKTPNQQRKEIIEKAKEFVEDEKENIERNSYKHIKFIENVEKRRVVCLVRGDFLKKSATKASQNVHQMTYSTNTSVKPLH